MTWNRFRNLSVQINGNTCVSFIQGNGSFPSKLHIYLTVQSAQYSGNLKQRSKWYYKNWVTWVWLWCSFWAYDIYREKYTRYCVFFCSDYILNSRSICIVMMTWNGNIFCVAGLCKGNSPVTGEFPLQRLSFDVFFDLLNKRLSKPTRRWWFETPSRSLYRHCITQCFRLLHWHWVNRSAIYSLGQSDANMRQ